MLRYREGEPLVELVQHLAAAASTGDEAAGAGGAGTAAPGEPEGANGATRGAAVASTAALPLPPRVEVRVPADAASNQNRQVRARQLWGKDKREERGGGREMAFFLWRRRAEDSYKVRRRG